MVTAKVSDAPTSCHRQSLLKENDIGIIPRQIPPQNILQRLFWRETGRCSRRHLGRELNCTATALYTNVFPNFTVCNIEKPACYLRKFSPDGRYLIAFSADQTSLEIYEFLGPSVAATMLNEISATVSGTDCLLDTIDTPAAARVRAQIFSQFFTLKRSTSVAMNGESLNRECSLFTDDGLYVVVGSASFVSEDQHQAPHFHDIYRTNESLSPNQRSPLEDFTLHIVDIGAGRVTDRRKFRCDKIFLSHNQGVYLYGSTLAVLSVQQQTIHIYRITSEGTFIDLRSIGRFCFDDDNYVVSSAYVSSSTHKHTIDRPYYDAAINSLKHRLLVHLYRQAEAESANVGRKRPLREFFQHFDEFRRLRMWKMQLLDESHLLIRYASEEVCALRASDPNTQPSFFVVYDMVHARVLAAYDSASEDLLSLYENHCDTLRYPAASAESPSSCVTRFASSPSTNIYARQAHERFKQTIAGARYGGRAEAVRRVLAQLPISAQSYSTSPYLDLALYSYDDKWVSAMERPKACGDHPIRFYARDSGLLKFKIHTGVVGSRSPPPNARRLVAFTFHPSEPFAISVQRTNAEGKCRCFHRCSQQRRFFRGCITEFVGTSVSGIAGRFADYPETYRLTVKR